MNFTKFFIFGLVVAPLAACNTPAVNITSTPLQFNIAQPAAPAPVVLENLNFRVVTKDSIDAFVKEQVVSQGNANPVFVVIGTKDYQAIRLNLAELQRYIAQQQQIIVYYKKAISNADAISASKVPTKN